MAGHTEVAVGIDVAKAQVDVAVQPTGDIWTGPRSRGSLRRLRGWLAARRPTRIGLEATGGYERAVVAGLAGLPVVVVNPRQVRDFAPRPRHPGQDRSAGCSRAGALRGGGAPPRRPQPSKVERRLQTLGRRRHQLVKTRVTEQQQRRHLEPAELAGSDARLAVVTRLIQQADRDLAALVQAEPTLRPRATWLQRIPGIGR